MNDENDIINKKVNIIKKCLRKLSQNIFREQDDGKKVQHLTVVIKRQLSKP